MGRMMREYFLPLLGNFGFLEYLKHDPSVPDSDVTPEYCAQHNWLIGSPATVAEKLERVYREVGGFGSLLVFGFDYAENPEAWHNSLRLLARGGGAAGQASDPVRGDARIVQRLASLGLDLRRRCRPQPGVVLPFPWVRIAGSRVFVSGHGPLAADGSMVKPFGKSART